MAAPFLEPKSTDGARTSTRIAAKCYAKEKQIRNGDLRFASVAGLGQRLEGLRLQLAIALQQNFHLAFGFFEFLAAGTGQFHALVKKLQRPVEGYVSLFQFSYDRFQTLERFLKLGQAQTPLPILCSIREKQSIRIQ